MQKSGFSAWMSALASTKTQSSVENMVKHRLLNRNVCVSKYVYQSMSIKVCVCVACEVFVCVCLSLSLPPSLCVCVCVSSRLLHIWSAIRSALNYVGNGPGQFVGSYVVNRVLTTRLVQ